MWKIERVLETPPALLDERGQHSALSMLHATC